MTKEKGNTKTKKVEEISLTDTPIELGTDIKSADDLKKFLISLRDRMSDSTCPPVYALGALAHALSLSGIYQMLTEENREIARDVWLRLKQSGLHVKAPPMLFNEDEKTHIVVR